MASNPAVLAPLGKWAQDSNIIELQRKEVGGLFSKVPYKGGVGTVGWYAPVVIGNPAGAGATLAIAQDIARNGVGRNTVAKKWSGTWGEYDLVVDFPHKDIVALDGNNARAYLDLKKAETEQILVTGFNAMASLFYANAGKSLGTGTISAGVITLDNASDVVKFNVGDILNASANDGTSTGHSLLGPATDGYVYAIDAAAGKISVATSHANAAAGTAGTPTAWAGTMYLFRKGDFGGTASPNKIFTPFGAWVPPTAPSAGDSFNGVDRSVNPALLAGLLVPSALVATQTTAQKIRTAATLLKTRNQAARPNICVINTEKWESVARELEGNQWKDAAKPGNYSGNDSIYIRTPNGSLELTADDYCPSNTCFVGNIEASGLHFEGLTKKMFDVVDQDGATIMRVGDTNDFEMRMVAYPELICQAPGNWARVAI